MHLSEPGRRLLLTAGLASLTGCPFPGPSPFPDGDPLDTEPPLMVEMDLTCDLDAEAWTLTAEADAWTGNGVLSWSPDLEYVEVHDVLSVRAAADGTSDSLRLVLPIVGDWREATPSVDTAIRCGQDPSWIVVIFDRDGEPSDCRTGGPEPDALAVLEGVTPCSDDP